MPVVVTDIAPSIPLLRCASRSIFKVTDTMFVTQCTRPPIGGVFCTHHVHGVRYTPVKYRHPRLRAMLDASERTEYPTLYRGLPNVGNTCYLNAITTAVVWALNRSQMGPMLAPFFDHVTGGDPLPTVKWTDVMCGSSIANIHIQNDAVEVFEHLCEKHLQWQGVQTATYTDVMWRLPVPDRDCVLQELVGEITKPADQLAIQLKIFSNNLHKNLHKIRINKLLTLDGSQYELRSIVLHVGKSIQSGHYISLCKVGDDWLTFDDDTVSTDIPTGLARPYFCLYNKTP